MPDYESAHTATPVSKKALRLLLLKDLKNNAHDGLFTEYAAEPESLNTFKGLYKDGFLVQVMNGKSPNTYALTKDALSLPSETLDEMIEKETRKHV